MTIRTRMHYTLSLLGVGLGCAVSAAVWIGAGLAGDYELSRTAFTLALGCGAVVALHVGADYASRQRVSQDCSSCHVPFVPARDETVCGRCLDGGR